jgi:transcription termination factor NusA
MSRIKKAAGARRHDDHLPENSLEAPEDGLLYQHEADAAGDRIRVDQVSLYTDPTQNTVQRIALGQLLESPFNPRRTFNQTALEQMADGIRSVGVMQAILVRPIALPEGWSINRGDEVLQPYEIVFGHRRYRASKIAGVPDIPAIVRELTDAQAKQLQAIENVQREDLNPMEAARSYRQYLQAHQVSKDQLAKEIGLSRSHVYSYLTLLSAVPMIQEAVEKGEIGPDVAIKIARLHTPKLQERALSAIKGKYYDLEDGGKKTVRQIADFLAEKFTLKLSEAIFDTKDATLLQGADACTTCPKRTGNAPEFVDIVDKKDDGHYYRSPRGPNLCTDPDCFDAKKKAHLARKAADLEAKGKTVIAGNKARALVSAEGQLKEGYVALKDVKSELAKATKSRKTLAGNPVEVTSVVIQNPRDGKTIEAVKVDDLKAAGVKVKAPKSSSRGGYAEQQRRNEEEHLKRQERALAETKVNSALLAAVRKAAAAQPRSTFDMQLIAHVALAGVDYHSHGTLEILHGVDSYDKLRKAVGSMGAEQLTALLLDCALVKGVVCHAYSPEKPEALLAAAKHYGVDVAEIRAEVAKLPVDVKSGDLLKSADATEAPTPAGAPPAASPQEPGSAIDAWNKTFPKAAKKTGKKKQGAADAAQGEEASSASTELASLTNWPPYVVMLRDAGITTREQLADLDVDELVAITGQDAASAGDLIMKAREAIGEGAAA